MIGVLYAPRDYAGVMRRLFIDFVDMLVAMLITSIIDIPLLLLLQDVTYLRPIIYLTFAIVLFAYLVLLKRSRFRTIGYRLAGARIVNLQGERPSVGSLTVRLLFAVAGPFNFLFDLLWISGDPACQALRDKFAHTYVIRHTAVPSAAGEIVYGTYTVFGMTLLVKEVKPAPPAPAVVT